MEDRLGFRGWLVKEKRMVELRSISMFCETARFNDGDHPSGLNLVIPAQIIPMQCTGMKDKNGTLIYEGDELKVRGGNGYVAWDHHEWNLMYGNTRVTLWSIRTEKESIVVGNIYEEKEPKSAPVAVIDAETKAAMIVIADWMREAADG